LRVRADLVPGPLQALDLGQGVLIQVQKDGDYLEVATEVASLHSNVIRFMPAARSDPQMDGRGLRDRNLGRDRQARRGVLGS
jgi:hypothetical protein